MIERPRRYRTILSLHLVILLIPFLMFYQVVPFISSLTFAGDCLNFTILEQMELLFSIKMGSFPLYCPGFAGGQTSWALTLGQLFHPISWFSSHMPGYWEGNAIEWNVLFRLISLGAAQLLLFTFLRQLKLESLVAFLISFVTVYNVQLTHAFFFGATVESLTGLLFLCAATGMFYLNQGNGKLCFLIIGATYWLVCSGHPVMIYYGALGVVIFTLVLPHFVAVIFPEKKVLAKDVIIFWSRTAFLCSIGVLLSAAFLLPYYWDFLAPGVERLGKSYGWADVYRGTFIGALNNFFQPLDGGGFGGTPLYLLAGMIPLLLFLRIRVPLVILVIWSVALLAFLHMLGGLTPVHYLAWKYLPFASHLRIPGRISTIIPVLFMLLLVWIYKIDVSQWKVSGRERKINPAIALGILAVSLMAVHFLLPDRIVSDPYIYNIKNSQDIADWVLTANAVLGFSIITAFSAGCILPDKNYRHYFLLFLVLATIIQMALMLHHGIAKESTRTTLSLQQMVDQKKERLEYRYFPAWGIESDTVKIQAERSFLEPFLGKLYEKYIPAEDNDHAYSLMQQSHRPDRVIVEGFDSQYSPFQYVAGKIKHKGAYVKLIYASFNRLTFEVSSPESGFFGLSYPFTEHWKATVDGQEARVFRANGASQAVAVSDGRHLIDFRYRSDAAVYGLGLSYLTVIAVAFFSVRCFRKKLIGVLISAIVAITCIAVFVLWYQSLYAGDNLHTSYQWEPPADSARENIAYGKRTSISPVRDLSYLSQMLMEYPYMRSAGKAVDGDKTRGAGFFTGFQSEPWWMVDLYREEIIGSVVIHQSRTGDGWNKHPLVIAFSNDAQSWKGTSVSSHETPMHVNFPRPVSARYIMIKSCGTCRLSLDEVEIFAPE